ncbi:MAG: DUF3153 domain-containing protein [Synechococcus sp.]|nr:DUF3153 domain-containing protein [Synechococcus sp.]
MAEAGLDPAVARVLAEARVAIERGDYGLSLRLLEPLAAAHGPVSAIGAGVRLLQATALMGQGEAERAIACCRSLQACLDPTLRARARDLLVVLEAPALRRPRHWSLTLPELGPEASLESLGAAPLRRRRPGPPPAPPPPVGETRAPRGFAALAAILLVLLLLASLLGGCLEVHSELRFAGPGRLQLSHRLAGEEGPSGPWPQRFERALGQGAIPFQRRLDAHGLQLSTAVLPAAAALAALDQSLTAAAALADVELPPPLLSLQETNWLLGVWQQLSLDLDLCRLDGLPSPHLELQLSPLRRRAVRFASPQPALAVPRRAGAPAAVIWRLQPGRRNQLQIRCWRWSPLGLGGLLIGLALLLALLLQRLRLALGFGLPQLPA